MMTFTLKLGYSSFFFDQTISKNDYSEEFLIQSWGGGDKEPEAKRGRKYATINEW